jgi:ketosteroid isomerase-like protein
VLFLFVFTCQQGWSQVHRNPSPQSNNPNQTDPAARNSIIQNLNKWSDDFNAKNLDAICSLFAPDLVATFPGAKDRDFKGMCDSLKAAVEGNVGYHYEKPEIEQVIVQGNLAVVRLIWTLKITSDTSEERTVKERGLDVFKRQPNGSWKIAISYAHPY